MTTEERIEKIEKHIQQLSGHVFAKAASRMHPIMLTGSYCGPVPTGEAQILRAVIPINCVVGDVAVRFACSNSKVKSAIVSIGLLSNEELYLESRTVKKGVVITRYDKSLYAGDFLRVMFSCNDNNVDPVEDTVECDIAVCLLSSAFKKNKEEEDGG